MKAPTPGDLHVRWTGIRTRRMPSLQEVIEHFVAAFAAIFPMVNPFSTMPLFLSLTARMSADRRKSQATKASILSAIIMLVVLFIGAGIMHFFGISIAALRVAGGLIIAYIGFRMLFPTATPTPGAAPSHDEAELDFSFMPLAFPSLAGAGTMAVVMSMATHAAASATIRMKLRAYVLISVAILAVTLVTWLILRASTRLTRFLGPQGVDAMTRIMGLLLVCIGVQFVATGVRNFISE